MSAPDELLEDCDPERFEITMNAPIELVLNDTSHENLAVIQPWGKHGDVYRVLVLVEASMLVRDHEARLACQKWLLAKRRGKQMFETIRSTEARVVEKTRGAVVSLGGLPEVTGTHGRAWCWISDTGMQFRFEPKEKAQ